MERKKRKLTSDDLRLTARQKELVTKNYRLAYFGIKKVRKPLHLTNDEWLSECFLILMYVVKHWKKRISKLSNYYIFALRRHRKRLIIQAETSKHQFLAQRRIIFPDKLVDERGRTVHEFVSARELLDITLSAVPIRYRAAVSDYFAGHGARQSGLRYKLQHIKFREGLAIALDTGRTLMRDHLVQHGCCSECQKPIYQPDTAWCESCAVEQVCKAYAKQHTEARKAKRKQVKGVDQVAAGRYRQDREDSGVAVAEHPDNRSERRKIKIPRLAGPSKRVVRKR